MSSESERLELCKECTHTCVVGTEYESESCDLQRGKSTPPDVICSMCSEGSEEGNPTVGDHRFGICLDCHTRTGRVFAATSDTQPLKPSGGAVDAPDPGAINRRVRCIRAALETVDEFAHPGVVHDLEVLATLSRHVQGQGGHVGPPSCFGHSPESPEPSM